MALRAFHARSLCPSRLGSKCLTYRWLLHDLLRILFPVNSLHNGLRFLLNLAAHWCENLSQ